MRKIILPMALFAFASVALWAADGGAIEANGKYHWVHGGGKKHDNGDLKAFFTPAGKNKWTVKFHFSWKKEKHVYSGVVTGSLKNGSLSGRIESDDKKPRIFAFSANAKDGAITGKHWEIRTRKGKEIKTDTGTFELSL